MPKPDRLFKDFMDGDGIILEERTAWRPDGGRRRWDCSRIEITRDEIKKLYARYCQNDESSN